MKMTKQMKMIMIVIMSLFMANAHSQSTYLKFTNTENKTAISYAPNTKFEVKNEHGYIQMKNADSPYQLKIEDEGYTLTVYPTYKKGKDVYRLNKGALVERIVTTENMLYEHANFYTNGNKVTGTKKVTKSLTKDNTYNLDFELSNGISFSYIDGKYNAKLDDQYLDVKYKYVIKSKLGTLKLSFNPRNGETWWVFEEKK